LFGIQLQNVYVKIWFSLIGQNLIFISYLYICILHYLEFFKSNFCAALNMKLLWVFAILSVFAALFDADALVLPNCGRILLKRCQSLYMAEKVPLVANGKRIEADEGTSMLAVGDYNSVFNM